MALSLRRPRGLSLFWKVYLTVVAAVALVALAGAIVFRITAAAERGPWAERGRIFFERTLPADDPGPTLDRLADALGADLALRDPGGRLVAGDPGLDRRGRVFVFTLSDGRVVQARFGRADSSGEGGDDDRNPLIPIAIIAILIALVAYPVVGHLTRRLERLRAGVEAWGAGDLSARIGLSGADEVAAVAKSFDAAAATVERLVASHSALLANASHELRSPLARLRMAIDLFEEDPRPALRQEIVTSLSELDALVEEILVASRLDHVAGLERRERVDLLALVAEEGARVDATVEGDAVEIVGDPRLLRRLVRNLFQNAARHGAPPIEARVERRDAGGVRLVVRDHGPGLPDGEAERVFEAFYRPAGRSEAAGSWGLGLALVRQIARRHGGEALYARPNGEGAAFVAELPGVPDGERL
ncbi:HAMP domain-containing sensor histidine kinase [Salinarimonas ramus]|uniref:histidine kinase n=1 Tax=Salinarimonas ramus TaxID=690164 RepID=A0A917Q7L2_9HYPH|nr:HAMP domain-containing sensor histidine kinase [Salinarimonas ramus]GGK34428.1 two-component sensor histidine kinase [Salinarimonas ramus]